jgi:hypothetical protein
VQEERPEESAPVQGPAQELPQEAPEGTREEQQPQGVLESAQERPEALLGVLPASASVQEERLEAPSPGLLQEALQGEPVWVPGRQSELVQPLGPGAPRLGWVQAQV